MIRRVHLNWSAEWIPSCSTSGKVASPIILGDLSHHELTTSSLGGMILPESPNSRRVEISIIFRPLD